MNNPIMYSDMAAANYFNLQPSAIKGTANSVTDDNKRYLYDKLYSNFVFTIPESWDINFFRFWLFHCGSIGVIYTKEFGWIAQPYSITELNINYNPRRIEVYNQFIKTPRAGIIGLNAGIIHIFDDYYGIDDLVTRYAARLAAIDKAIDVNLFNSGIGQIYGAKSKKEADDIYTAYAKASDGNPLVIINKDITDGETLAPVLPAIGNNYIADKLLLTRRGVVNQFLTEIGIANANYEKRERMNNAEVQQNAAEVKAVVTVMLENMRHDMEVINSISGLGLSVELRNGGATEWAE